MEARVSQSDFTCLIRRFWQGFTLFHRALHLHCTFAYMHREERSIDGVGVDIHHGLFNVRLMGIEQRRPNSRFRRDLAFGFLLKLHNRRLMVVVIAVESHYLYLDSIDSPLRRFAVCHLRGDSRCSSESCPSE